MKAKIINKKSDYFGETFDVKRVVHIDELTLYVLEMDEQDMPFLNTEIEIVNVKKEESTPLSVSGSFQNRDYASSIKEEANPSYSALEKIKAVVRILTSIKVEVGGFGNLEKMRNSLSYKEANPYIEEKMRETVERINKLNTAVSKNLEFKIEDEEIEFELPETNANSLGLVDVIESQEEHEKKMEIIKKAMKVLDQTITSASAMENRLMFTVEALTKNKETNILSQPSFIGINQTDQTAKYILKLLS